MSIGPFREVGYIIHKVASARLARARSWPEAVQGKQREREFWGFGVVFRVQLGVIEKKARDDVLVPVLGFVRILLLSQRLEE